MAEASGQDDGPLYPGSNQPPPEQAELVRLRGWSNRDALAGLTHDINSTLATITASAELLEQNPATEDSRFLTNLILRQVSCLQNMIQELSEAVTVNRLELVLREEHIDLSSLVKETVVDAQRLVNSHQFHVEVPSAAPAKVDCDKVRRILRNLLDNACRYSPAGTSIYVRLRHTTTDKEAIIEIEDEGPGIPEEMRSKIFNPFVRLDAASGSGHGLGLYVVQQLAAAHGGEACVEEGRLGTRFKVSLPVLSSD